MNVVVAIDTVLLALLCILTVGLLRSHAEILRRTAPSAGGQANTDPGTDARLRSERLDHLPPPRAEDGTAYDISGQSLDGAAVKIAVGAADNTLLAFLGSGCSACMPFWEGLSAVQDGGLPGTTRIVVVAKDATHESPSRLRTLIPAGTRFVMSSSAYTDYNVELTPYFIYVEGTSNAVVSEGSAVTWSQVISLLRDSFADRELARAPEDREAEEVMKQTGIPAEGR
jgi:hypothetical protein